MRHGRTAWNAEGRLQGRTDVPLLPEEAARLATLTVPPGWEGATVLASTLSRAVETARLVTGRTPERDERLSEGGYGRWEGLRGADLRADPASGFRDVEAMGWDYAPHGGETNAAVRDRALAAVWDWVGRVAGAPDAARGAGSASRSADPGLSKDGELRDTRQPPPLPTLPPAAGGEGFRSDARAARPLSSRSGGRAREGGQAAVTFPSRATGLEPVPRLLIVTHLGVMRVLLAVAHGWDFDGPMPFRVKRDRLFVLHAGNGTLTPADVERLVAR